MPQEECCAGRQVSISLIPHRWGPGGQGFCFMDGLINNKQAYSNQEVASASELSAEASQEEL